MVRGDIYLVKLDPRSGSEQRGHRPGIIVSHNSFNKQSKWKSITIIPLTSSERWLKGSPSTVLFDKDESGLNKRCAALTHQITTIDKSKCVGLIGKCSVKKLALLDQAISNYLYLKS